ncbi:MAG TPA: response regulator transcription factor [Anaerolineaceae bacterium]|nr:response regulator transcription factor [Anaerolineaceae bacterium]
MPEEQTQKISVLLVDDHIIVRQGLRTFLELQDDILVVGEAANGKQAVEQAGRLRPQVVLMDLVMPEMDGIAATRQICALGQGIKVLALTSFVEDERVLQAVQAGATGYLLKDVAPNDLVEAVRAAARGESRLHPDAAQKLMKQVVTLSTQPTATPQAGSDLTEREVEVLRLVARGMSNREIAETLVISEKTVKTHVSSLLSKLNLVARTQLAIYAIKHGLAEK